MKTTERDLTVCSYGYHYRNVKVFYTYVYINNEVLPCNYLIQFFQYLLFYCFNL